MTVADIVWAAVILTGTSYLLYRSFRKKNGCSGCGCDGGSCCKPK